MGGSLYLGESFIRRFQPYTTYRLSLVNVYMHSSGGRPGLGGDQIRSRQNLLLLLLEAEVGLHPASLGLVELLQLLLALPGLPLLELLLGLGLASTLLALLLNVALENTKTKNSMS